MYDDEYLETISQKLSDATLQLARVCWRQFYESSHGMLVRLFLPNESIRLQCRLLFLSGFGSRMSAEFFEPDSSESRSAHFERSWQRRLDVSDGKVLFDNPEHPDTPPLTRHIAKTFYKLGYMRADILLDK